LERNFDRRTGFAGGWTELTELTEFTGVWGVLDRRTGFAG